MSELVATAILPYTLVLGVVTSILATTMLAVATFRKQFTGRQISARLAKIEAAVREDTAKIDLQVSRATLIEPEQAAFVLDDLGAIASDLGRKTAEMQMILSSFRSTNAQNETPETRKQLADLGLGVGETEARVKRLMKRIEREQQKLSNTIQDNGMDRVNG